MKNNVTVFEHVLSSENLADFLTKQASRKLSHDLNYVATCM